MPDPTTITLSNGCVVKVGDRILLKDGTPLTIYRVHQSGFSAAPKNGIGHSFNLRGMCECCPISDKDVDLTALAQSAPAVPVERLLALAKEIAACVVRGVCELGDRTSPDDGPDMLSVSEDELTSIVEHECAAALEALAAEGGK